MNIYFWTPRGPIGWAVRLLTGSYYSHTAVELEDCVYHTAIFRKTGWHLREALPEPDEILMVPTGGISYQILDQILPKQQRFPLWGSLRYALFGGIPPLTCVGSVHRVFLLAGIQPEGWTPDDLRRQALHIASTAGTSNQPAPDRS